MFEMFLLFQKENNKSEDSLKLIIQIKRNKTLWQQNKIAAIFLVAERRNNRNNSKLFLKYKKLKWIKM